MIPAKILAKSRFPQTLKLYLLRPFSLMFFVELDSIASHFTDDTCKDAYDTIWTNPSKLNLCISLSLDAS
jgi:hypothetical protein